MKILNKFRNSSFWHSVVSLSAGQIIGQAITLFTTPIVSRLYSSDEYGEFGIITSTATIIIGIIGLGLGSMIMVAKDDKDAKKIFMVTYLLQFSLAILLCAGMLVMSPVKRFYETTIAYELSLLLMFFYISANMLTSLLNVYINRLKLNKALFLNPLIAAGCTIVITIPLGFMKIGFIGLMLASIFSSLLASIHMLRYNSPFGICVRISDVRYVIREGRKFILFQYPANLMGTVAGQLPNQMLSNLFGNAALGSYTMCNKLFNLPMNLIATPIQTVYFRTAAEKNSKNESIAPLTYSLVTKICYVAFLPALLVILFGEQLFAFTLGGEWSKAGIIASILVLHYILTFCNNCIIYCRVSIGKQKWNLFAAVIQLTIIFASLYVGYALTGTLLGVLKFFGIFNALWQIINIEISFICLKQYYLRWPLFSLSYSLVIIACYLAVHGI